MTLVNFPGPRKGWEAELTRTARGHVAATVGNISAIFRSDAQWSGRLAYNERAGTVLWLEPPPWLVSEPDQWTPRELRDSDHARAAEWFERSRFEIPLSPMSEALRGALAIAAEDQCFDPVSQYLSSLVWDGTPRLDMLLARYFGADEEDDARAEYQRACGARTCIGAVARAFQPGSKVDHVLILCGAQGIGKSTAIRILAGADHFGDALPDLRGKDSADYVRGPWIIELSELDSLNRSELSTAKAFISRVEDRFRAAYGRRTQTYPRRCIFIGSTNQDSFLSDVTGNRRFWPVSVGNIDLGALRRDRDQLWAEAVTRYRAGEVWHMDSERLATAAVRAQEDRQVVDAWRPAIEAFLAGRERVSVGEVLRGCLGLEIERWGQAEQNRVARVLRQLGWSRHQFRGEGSRRSWLYVRGTP